MVKGQTTAISKCEYLTISQTENATDVWRPGRARQCELGVGSVSPALLDDLLLLYLEKCQILREG